MRIVFTFIFSLVAAEFAFAQLNAPGIVWEQSYGGALSDVIYSAALTKDGGAMLAGYTASGEDTTGKVITCGADVDMLIIQINSHGKMISTRVIDGVNQDVANCIIPSRNGGYIICGTSNSVGEDFSGNHGDNDIVLLKLGDKGSVDWLTCYGGSKYDDAGAVVENTDGTLVAAGESYSSNGDVSCNNGNSDLWIFKTDERGKLLWQRNYGGSGYEKANSLVKCSNGDYLIAGNSNSNDGDAQGNHGGDDGWLIRTDSSGCLKWQRCYGGSKDDVFNQVKALPDGSFILCGYTYSNDGDVSGNHGDADAWIVKVDSSGNIIWQKTLGGYSSEFALSLDLTQNNNILVGGFCRSSDGNCSANFGQRDMWVFSLSQNGKLLWQKNYGGSDNDVCYSIHETEDDEILAAGYTKSKDGEVTGNHGREDFWVVKLGNKNPSENNIPSIPELATSFTRDYFRLEPEDAGILAPGQLNMAVYDAFGRKVLSKAIGNLPVDVTAWQPGLYTIIVTNSEQMIASKKVIRLD